jgi:hypothetical protein
MSRTERPAVISSRFNPARTTVIQRCSCGQSAQSGGECDECQRKREGSHRSSLTIGQPDDAFEREADRVAARIVEPDKGAIVGAMPVSSSPRSPFQRVEVSRFDDQAAIRRKGLNCGSCASAPSGQETAEDEEREGTSETVRAKAEGGRLGPANRALERSLSSSRGGGTPLAPDTRAFMESRFGEDLSAVRVHTDQRASAMNRQLHAAAFTSGRDIYFRTGRYDTSSLEGNRLLAHELTHVIQQRKGIGGADASHGSAPVQHYIQRFSLKGFPKAEEAAMRAAIPKAIATVKGCSKLSWYGRHLIARAVNNKRYDYTPDLGLCGWTFPGSWYIKVGKDAFDHSTCCDLESTLAHEASHTVLYTEGRARKMECTCFGCSC